MRDRYLTGTLYWMTIRGPLLRPPSSQTPSPTPGRQARRRPSPRHCRGSRPRSAFRRRRPRGYPAATGSRPGIPCLDEPPLPWRRRGRKYRRDGRSWGSSRSSCSRPGPGRAHWSFSNIRTPRRASISAISCGVETITAPVSATRCAMVNCASPVPGGMSTTRISSAPHATWPIICSSAPITIGPRQIIAVSSSTRKPIDMQDKPRPAAGSSCRPRTSGLRFRPIMRGRLGP